MYRTEALESAFADIDSMFCNWKADLVGGCAASPEGLAGSLFAVRFEVPPPSRRMNPPRKVGARSPVPGFRINGHESPFRVLS